MFYLYDAIFRCCRGLYGFTGALHRATDRHTLRIQKWALRGAYKHRPQAKQDMP